MPQTITLVDYGSGNVLSVRRALEYNGANVVLTNDPAKVAVAERLVLPGVGAFGDCMNALVHRQLIPAVLDFIQTGRPFLGICVGMQILMEVGHEFGLNDGMGLIGGDVLAIPSVGSDGTAHKIPHIGWSDIYPPDATANSAWQNTVLQDTDPGTSFYFVHSMTAHPRDPNHLLARCDYHGCPVTAAVHKDNVTGLQFHPEKSAKAGLQLLNRFITM